MPTSPEMEIRSKKSRWQPALSEPEEMHAKKKLKVAPSVVPPLRAVVPSVTILSSPTPAAPAPKDKRKALATTLMRRSPCLVMGEKLTTGAMRAAHAIDTHEQFPKASLQRRRLQKQLSKEPGNGSTFPGVKKFPQELLFAAMRFEELGESFGGDESDSGHNLPEEGDWLAIVASPPLSETRVSHMDIVALQGNIFFLLSFL